MSNRILAVDDDKDILRVLKANLELYNYEVETADTWAAAQEILSSKGIDLILLDIMLPDGDGMEICKQIRHTNTTLPIIMLTAKDKVSDKVIGLESGADDYIVKPFETLELLARIKACLRRVSPPEMQAREVIGPIEIDYRKHLVKVAGRRVELTPKEYEILCLLLSKRGEVISRETIKKGIYKDSQVYSWSRVVDVHIQHLRQKIEEDPSNPQYILTVTGAGYRFMD